MSDAVKAPKPVAQKMLHIFVVFSMVLSVVGATNLVFATPASAFSKYMYLLKSGTFDDQNGDGFPQVGETITYDFTVASISTEVLTNVIVTDPLMPVTGGPITLNPILANSSDPLGNEATVISPAGSFDLLITNTPPALTQEVTYCVDDSWVDDPTLGIVCGVGGLGVSGSAVVSAESTTQISLTPNPMPTATLDLIYVAQDAEIDTTTFSGVYSITNQNIIDGFVSNQAIVTATRFNSPVTDFSDDPAGGGDPTATNGTDDPTVFFFPEPYDHALVKTGVFADENGDGFAQPGETIDYTFEINNLGSAPLTSALINDISGGVTITGSPIPSLPGYATDDTTYSATYTVTQADIDLGYHENQASLYTNEVATNDLSGTAIDNDDVTVVTLPVLTELLLEKTDAFQDESGDGFAQAGETIDYTFNIINNSNVAISDVTVIDPVFGVVVSGSPFTMAPETSDNTSYTGTYTLTQADVNAGEYSNQASVSGTSPINTVFKFSDDPDNATSDSDQTVTNLPTEEEIRLTKAGVFQDENGDGFAEAGETIAYTFGVYNRGDTALTNVTLTDILGGVTLSGSPIASLAPGAIDSTTFTASYTLTQPDVEAGTFRNQAFVTTDQGVTDYSDRTIFGNSPSVVTYTPLTEVALIKTGTFADQNGDGFAQYLEAISYTFTIENTGAVPLTNVTVSDTLGGVTVIGSPIASLAPGAVDSSTFSANYNLSFADLEAGEFTNQATVSSDEGASDISGATNGDDDETVVSFTSNRSVALLKLGTFADENGDGFAQVGETIDYAFQVHNTGDLPLDNVVVSDPAGGVTVTGSLPTLLYPPGIDTSSIVGSYTLTQADINAGQYTNSATVSADGALTDTSGSTTTDDDPTVVSYATNADVGLVKTGTFQDENGDGFAQVGETIDYTFAIENTGDVDLTNVEVADTTAGVVVSGSPIASLGVSGVDSSTYTASYVLAQADLNAGQFTNSADVSSDEGAADTSGATNGDDDATVVTLLTDDEVSLVKTGTFNDTNGNGFAEAGETIDYAFAIENTGSVPLSNVVVSDTVGGVTVSGAAIASLAPGVTDDTSFTASYTLVQADIDVAKFDNTATVDADEGTTFVDSETTLLTVESNISLAKTGVFADEDGDGFAQAGESIDYTFDIENTGGVTLTNVIVSDTVGGVTVSGSAIASLGAGTTDSSSYSASYTLVQADIDAGEFVNAASVVSDEGAIANGGTTTVLTVNADVALTKAGTFTDESGDGFAQVGETIDYTFAVENTGDVTLTNVDVSDTVGGVTMAGAAIATLAPGAVDASTFTATYTLTQTDLDAGEFVNSATVTSDEGTSDVSGATNTDDDSTVVPLVTNDEIKLLKAGVFADENGDGFAQVGETIDYTFTVENTGDVTLTNVDVSDTVGGVTMSGSPVVSLAPSAVDSTTFTASYALTQADVDVGEFVNSATVTSDEGATDVSGLTNADDDVTTTTFSVNDEVTLVKAGVFADESGDGFAQVGETVDYTFTVENTGGVTLTNVAVSDTVGGVTIVGSPIASLAPGSVDNSNFTASYSLVQADIDVARFFNTATVAADEGATADSDETTLFDVESTITLVKVGTFADESGDGFAQAGETIDYTFSIENTGGVTLSNVTISDVVGGVTVSGSPIAALGASTTDAATFTASYTLTQADIDAGEFVNGATVTSDEGAIANGGTTTTLTVNPEVALVKTGVFADESGDGFAQAGETIDYVFAVENTGDVTLTDGVVVDTVGGVTVSGPPIASLAPGAVDSSSYSASYVLTQADIDAGEFVNQASVSTDEGVADVSGNTKNDDDATTVTLTTRQGVALVKTATVVDENGDGLGQVGETVDYVFAVENTGDVTLTNVAVSDTVGGVTLSGSAIASLAPGEVDDTTYSATYTFIQDDVDAGEFTNQASVVTDEGAADISGLTNTNDDMTAVNFSTFAESTLNKVGTFNDADGSGFAEAGETIDYEFVIENTGDVTLTDIFVNDTIGGVTLFSPVLGDLAPGATDNSHFTGSYTLVQADIDAAQFVNTATVTNDESASSFDEETTLLTVESAVSLVKTGVFADEDGDGFAQAGETIDYTFTVENTGGVTLTNVTVSDTVGGVTVSGSPIASLAPAAIDSTTYSATYTLTQADIDVAEFVNSAAVVTDEGATDTSGVTNTDDDTTDITFTTNDAVALVKAGTFADENGDGFAQVGETMGYTFAVENTGDVTLTNVIVSDSVGGVTVSGSPIASLAPGAIDNTSYTASYVLTLADLDAGVFVNSAAVITDEGTTDTSGVTIADDDTTDITFTTNDAVALVKSGTFADENGDGSAQVGETIDYIFAVENTGDVTLTNTIVSDAVGGVTVSGAAIVSLAPGAVDDTSYSASYALTQADVDAGQFANSASVVTDEGAADTSGVTKTDDDSSDVTFTANDEVALVKAGTFADENGDGFGQVGETIDYTFTVENTGDVTLTNIIVSDAVGGVTVSGAAIVSLAPGAVDDTSYSASYALTQADVDAGQFANSASVVTDEGAADTSGVTKTDDDSSDVTFATNAEVALVKAGTFADENGNGFAEAGETIDYTFAIRNEGDTTLTDVTVADTVSGVTVSGTPIVSLIPNVTDSASYTASYTLTQVDVDNLEFNNTAEVTTAEGVSDTSGITPADDLTTPVTFPILEAVALVKTGALADENGDGFAQAGETISYTFAVENTGGATLSNVEVSDSVGGVTITGSPIATLAPGVVDNTTYTASYTLVQADIEAGEFDNQASVSTDQGVSDLSGLTIADDDTSTTAFATNDDVALVKTGTFNDESGDGFAQVGETIDYIFTVENIGDVDLTNMIVTDAVSGVTLTGSAIASLAPGAFDSVTYTGTYALTLADLAAGQFQNQATVTTDEGATDLSGVTKSDDTAATVDFTATAELSIGTISPPTLQPGQTGVLSVVLNNGGPGESGTFDVTYVLPDSVTFDSSHPNPDGCTVTGNLVTCTGADRVPANGEIAVTIPLKLDSEATPDDVLSPTDVTIVNQSVPDTDPSNDSGVVQIATIGFTVSGHVYRDFSRDGVLDTGEVDISGVDVDLVAPGPDGTLGTADDITLDNQTTASPYLFLNVSDGTYWLVIDQPTLPLGVYATNDVDLDNNNIIEVTVDGADVVAQNFGVHYAAINGVFTDKNGDPIPNQEVIITDSAGNTFRTTTGPNGEYFVEGSEAVPLIAGEVTITAIIDGETITQTVTIVNALSVEVDVQATTAAPGVLAFTGQGLQGYLSAAVLLLAAGAFTIRRSREIAETVEANRSTVSAPR